MDTGGRCSFGELPSGDFILMHKSLGEDYSQHGYGEYNALFIFAKKKKKKKKIQ